MWRIAAMSGLSCAQTGPLLASLLRLDPLLAELLRLEAIVEIGFGLVGDIGGARLRHRLGRDMGDVGAPAVEADLLPAYLSRLRQQPVDIDLGGVGMRRVRRQRERAEAGRHWLVRKARLRRLADILAEALRAERREIDDADAERDRIAAAHQPFGALAQIGDIDDLLPAVELLQELGAEIIDE